MSDFTTVFNVIAKNSPDIEDMISKIGGIGAFLALLPDIIRIVQTVSASGTPPADVPDVVQFSASTKASVAAFQKKYGLTADGYVGNQTWSKVESLIG